MSGNAAFLARQIGLVQAAIKHPFDGDAALNAQLVAQLAAYLDGLGITDIRHLRWMDNGEGAFYYDSWTGNLLPNPAYGMDVVRARADPSAAKMLWAGQTKDFDQWVYVAFDSTGTLPVLYSVPRARRSDWADILTNVAVLAGVVVTVAFPALASEIGSAVLGPETAAAYPALAQGIGQAAISSTLNGGDVQAGVTGALAGGLGGGVGGAVSGATDSAIIGSAASAATKAAILGGDIEKAALSSLVSNGVASGADLVSSSVGAAMPDDTLTVDNSAPDYGTSYGSDPIWSDQGSPTEGAVQLDAGTYFHDPVWSADGSVEGSTVPMPGVTTPPAGPSGVITQTSSGASLTQLALAGLKLVTSWNGAGQPAIRQSNANVRANNDGTLTNLQTGAVSRMAVGTPYLTASNALVTNNGDGTYTVVSATGQASTGTYSASSLFGSTIAIPGLGNVSPVVLIGGAALLMIVLSQSKGK